MNKTHNITNYIDIVNENNNFFRNYYYHSIIDLNLVKLDLILKQGIFSKKLIEQNSLASIYTHDSRDFDSKNGNNYVSLSEYTDNCKFNILFDSFALHTLSSLSILIDKNINITRQGERETYFDDEIFCPNYISKSDIKGILVTEHLAKLPISEVCCLANDISCYTYKYIKNWITHMESYFNKKIDYEIIKNSLDDLWDILDEYERPENWIQSAINNQQKKYNKDINDILADILQKLWSEKFNLSNPSYMDVIIKLNQESLPIYEVKEKCLKHIY